jgi:hypothetical protein
MQREKSDTPGHYFRNARCDTVQPVYLIPCAVSAPPQITYSIFLQQTVNPKSSLVYPQNIITLRNKTVFNSKRSVIFSCFLSVPMSTPTTRHSSHTPQFRWWGWLPNLRKNLLPAYHLYPLLSCYPIPHLGFFTSSYSPSLPPVLLCLSFSCPICSNLHPPLITFPSTSSTFFHRLYCSLYPFFVFMA